MFEQKDIDKLLAGRKLIDSIKLINTDTLSSLQKALLPEEKTKTDIAVVVAAKEAIDVLREEEAVTIEAATDGLKKLGFNSIGEFLKFNEDMCVQALVECRPIQGKCDLCKGNLDKNGKETGPVCINVYRIVSCQSPDTIDVSNPQVAAYMHRISLKRIQKYGLDIYKVDGDIEQSSVCPPGHGFYIDRRLCKPFPFNTIWRAPHWEGLSNDEALVTLISSKYKDGAVKISEEEKDDTL